MDSQLENLLGACVVRITGDVGLRTGFFVAPRTVMTSARGIEEATSLTLFWKELEGEEERRAAASHRFTMLLNGESPVPEIRYESPGIAVLDVHSRDDHPCVAIDTALPDKDDNNALIFGYGDKGETVCFNPALLYHRPQSGKVSTFFMDMPSDPTGRGMEGSPVLSARSGGVCGVLLDIHPTTQGTRGIAIPWTAIRGDLQDLLVANQAFHEPDQRWAITVGSLPNPDSIADRDGFGRTLNAARLYTGLTIREVARQLDVVESTASNYFAGRALQPYSERLDGLLKICGISDPNLVERWHVALVRASLEDDQSDLLFRVYIPSERLYAAEAQRLLSLFREWLMTTRGYSIRQDMRHTTSGEMYEFFTDATLVQADRRELFDSFSSFLTLCSADPSAAVGMLASLGLGRAISADFIARVGRDARRLQRDLTHERERRILDIQHSIEEELVESGVELREVPRTQIHALIESLVPGPSATDSLALLAASQAARPTGSVTVNINPQIINAVESRIIQNVQGTVNFGPQAEELLSLIARFGGQEAPTLEAAVHELENVHTQPNDRSVAKRRLKKFLARLAESVHEVGLDLLEKYLVF
jgi:transcriptional regulator with XRE-family HTH domain